MKKLLAICLIVLLLPLAACTGSKSRKAADTSPPLPSASAFTPSGTPQQEASASPPSGASAGSSAGASAEPPSGAAAQSGGQSAKEETDTTVKDIIQQLNDLDKLYSQMDDINPSDLG